MACLAAVKIASLGRLRADFSRRILQHPLNFKGGRNRHAARTVDGARRHTSPSAAHSFACIAAAAFSTSRAHLTEIRACTAGQNYLNFGRAAYFTLQGCRRRGHHRLAALGSLQRLVHFLQLCLRAARTVVLLLPVLALYCAVALRRRSGDAGADDRIWRSALVGALARCGPTAVKFGQWASTRRDLFSPELCNALSRLQRAVQQHEWKHTQDVLVSRLGPQWQEKCTLDPMPVGSGCIAQVYKGYLHDHHVNEKVVGRRDGSGRVPVAVKVLHPHVREAMSDDLSIFRFVAHVIEQLVPGARYLNLTGCVDEFGTCLMGQVDLSMEARNLAMFNLKFAGYPSVKFARPLYPYVASDLLIETFEDGIPIASFIPGGQHEDGRLLSWAQAHAEPEEGMHDCRRQIASTGLHVMLKMIFEDNFVHADLHPGNISVQLPEPSAIGSWSSSVLAAFGDVWSVLRSVAGGGGGTAWATRSAKPTLVLYDCGIVSRLRSDAKAHFRDVFAAVVLDQGERVAELFLLHSAECGCMDVVAFKQEMVGLVHRLRGDSLVLGKVQVSRLLSDVFGLLSRNRIRLEKDFVNIMVAIAVLEGLGRSLDPEADLLKAAKGYLLP